MCVLNWDGTMDIYKPEHEIPDGIFIMDQTVKQILAVHQRRNFHGLSEKNSLLHVSAICCFACIITAILDWYNPYMAFSNILSHADHAVRVGHLAGTLRKRERPGMLRDR